MKWLLIYNIVLNACGFYLLQSIFQNVLLLLPFFSARILSKKQCKIKTYYIYYVDYNCLLVAVMVYIFKYRWHQILQNLIPVFKFYEVQLCENYYQIQPLGLPKWHQKKVPETKVEKIPNDILKMAFFTR